MADIVTIFGGSGFVGRYIARRLAAAGWEVRIAARKPSRAAANVGPVSGGKIVPVFANVSEEASVRAVLEGATVAVNCVGILEETGRNTFQALQADGSARIARLAKELGIKRMVQISAIGADAGSDSEYARTKAAGEESVLAHFPDAVILRPSIVFGREDDFFNRFAAMSQFSPALPVVGPETKFQPVFVDDVAAAAEAAVLGKAKPGTYELGGPEVESFRDLMKRMLKETGRKRAVVEIPFWAARLMGSAFDTAKHFSFGIIRGPLTLDQVKNLGRDNVVDADAKGLSELGITPKRLDEILPTYL
ncbi:MAG: complex I NDUFA9 subunit family protein [Pseudomonadota bacterium]